MKDLHWYNDAILTAKLRGLQLRVAELEQQRAAFIQSQRKSRH